MVTVNGDLITDQHVAFVTSAMYRVQNLIKRFATDMFFPQYVSLLVKRYNQLEVKCGVVCKVVYSIPKAIAYKDIYCKLH